MSRYCRLARSWGVGSTWFSVCLTAPGNSSTMIQYGSLFCFSLEGFLVRATASMSYTCWTIPLNRPTAFLLNFTCDLRLSPAASRLPHLGIIHTLRQQQHWGPPSNHLHRACYSAAEPRAIDCRGGWSEPQAVDSTHLPRIALRNPSVWGNPSE